MTKFMSFWTAAPKEMKSCRTQGDVCSFVRPFIRPPHSGFSGFKSGLSGLKSGLSDLKSGLSDLKFGLSSLKSGLASL